MQLSERDSVYSDMILPYRRAMESEHTSSPLPLARSASRLFAGMFAGAYALLLIDVSV